MGNLEMIPRGLFRLFHELETSNANCSAKISYVELYNEELRDPLARKLAAPSGSTSPAAHLGSAPARSRPCILYRARELQVTWAQLYQGYLDLPVAVESGQAALGVGAEIRRRNDDEYEGTKELPGDVEDIMWDSESSQRTRS